MKAKLTDPERKKLNARAAAISLYAQLCAIDKIREAVRIIHERYKDEEEYVYHLKLLNIERGVDWAVSGSAFAGEL